MTTVACTKPTELRWPLAAWLPVAVVPLAVGVLSARGPAWLRMWTLAIAIYGSLKWLTFATSRAARQVTIAEAVCYLFFWTGMDAESFFGQPARRDPLRWSQWAWAAGQTAFGFAILFAVAPRLVHSHPLVAGWLTMIGVVSVLHFGVSQLLSLGWRAAGINARHIMHKPLLATSLADFWGRRWNLAFRDVVHRFVLRPLAPTIGIGGATMVVFLVSGLIHDAVISLAAGGGWGLPTLYFLIQGIAILLERSEWGKQKGLGRGVIGWLFAAAVIVSPVGFLFHPPFIRNVVIPMLVALLGGTP